MNKQIPIGGFAVMSATVQEKKCDKKQMHFAIN